MGCFFPVQAWRSRRVNPSTRKRPVVFDKSQGLADMPVTLACGRCDGCRLERSRQWAVRCMHEASLYPRNCFVTLTYAPEFLPPGPSLDVRHVQLFLKRLRKRFCLLDRPEDGSPAADAIRFFLCGEYGPQFSRPHYHALLFNHDFSDKVSCGRSACGEVRYRSDVLQSLWGMGFCEVGSVSFKSASYVARYVLKKVSGSAAPGHYGETVTELGEVLVAHHPEFLLMSRRPGIARPWLDRFGSSDRPDDFVVVNGLRVAPPKFYQASLSASFVGPVDEFHPSPSEVLRRKRGAAFVSSEDTLARIGEREVVSAARIRTFQRSYES